MRIEKPRRVERTYTQMIDGTPGEIFPLYCPVREAEWVSGWDPVVVYSETGVAEHDCVFLTRDGDRETHWLVTRYEPQSHYVEMVRFTPGLTQCKLDIQLEPVDPKRTKVVVTYRHTSLGPEGDAFVDGFTEEYYREFMQGWEKAMNHFLATGEKLGE